MVAGTPTREASVVACVAAGLDHVQHRRTIPDAAHASLRQYAITDGRFVRL